MTNLKPAKFKTEMSEGMICCASCTVEEGSESKRIVETLEVKECGFRITLEGTNEYFRHIKRSEINLLKKEKYLNALKCFGITGNTLCFKGKKVLLNGKEIKTTMVANGEMK